MDSRLLNVFHDDAFDGNYVRYDPDTQFWSSGSETLGLQLEETLHGILPIAPTEVVSTSIYGNSMLRDEDYSLESKHDSNTNSIIYGDYEDAQSINMVNKRQVSGQQSIEIVAVDPNDDYDSEFLSFTDEENEDEENRLPIEAFDDVRSCSQSTFRSRTDSSSIGDYESHSSDYDDDDSDEEFGNGFTEDPNDCVLQDDFVLNTSADEKKTIDDVDAFGIHLDANNFDLAAFITQDDQMFDNHSSVVEVPCIELNASDSFDSESESDVIVDVETVEAVEIEPANENFWDQPKDNDIEYKDNVKSDPSWSPTKQKIEKKETKPEMRPAEPNFTNNFTVVPNKRQSDFLKRKFGVGRGKNLSMHRNPAKQASKPDSKSKSQQNTTNQQKNSVPAQAKTPAPEKKIENLPKKQETICPSKKLEKPIAGAKPIQKEPIVGNGKCKNLIKHDTESIKENTKEDSSHTESEEVVVIPIQPQKRKLNLEEYKKRRENPSAFPLISKNVRTVDSPPKLAKTEIAIQTIPPVALKPQPKPPSNAEVTSIVKSLKENQGPKRFVDPITEAKNKVLRLQELKKAQQIKIIDSTVSSKVGRVTKLPPLKDIVKDTYKIKDGDESGTHVISNPDYEEITIVSMGCNTDITIPPDGYNAVQPKVSGKNMSRSLLKSNVLMANISNSFQKVRSDDSVKISNNSLIVSIQDVVVKKSAPIPTEPIKAPQNSSTSMSEHGEDKVIMHLRKDRIRKRKITQSAQTELLPEFPALRLPLVENHTNGCESIQSKGRKSRRRKYRSRRESLSSDEEYRGRSRSSSRSMEKRSRRHRSSISSSYSESEDYPKRGRRYSGGSSSRSRERSISSGASGSRSFDKVYRNSRSRSKSSSRSRSRSRRCDSNRFVDRNVSAPAVEERRIVYVGRIEQDTTKEMLRRKFIGYGPIKQITIHYKDTGMKYGFVTYEKSEDAFRVIDSGQNDATINMYDISFGGRRAFCRASYADLDNAGINTYQSYVVPRPVLSPKEEDSFEALLLKVKAKLNATKSSNLNSKM